MGKDSCNWNITPVELVAEKAKGFFALGKWGCDGYHEEGTGKYIRTPEKFEQLIPICNVVKLTKIGEWENHVNDFGTEIGGKI
jgi:hypothetical protein